MKYDGYRFIEKEKMSSVINHDVLTLESVYRHFLEKDDECIYVTDREKLVGVVSVSDWQKAYAGGNVENCINTHFSYLKDIDFADAERLILRIKKIHEVPVIKNGKFIGVVVNGEHKSEKEWNGIRKDNRYIKYRIAEWEKEQLRELFNYVSPSVYVYFGFDEKNLKWTEHDFEMCDNKLKHKNWIAGLEEMSEEEQRDFFGEYYSEEYVREFINNLGEVSGSCKNGINMINDMHSKYINVVDGYRRIAEYKEQGERKIYFIGPCTFFGAYVSDNQTIEYYLYQLMKENNISGYEILNAGLLGPAITLSGKLLTESVSDDDIVIYWAVMDKNALKDMKDIYPNIKIGSDWTEAFNSIENPVGNILDGLAHCNYKINKRLADIIFNDIKPELEQKFDRGGGARREPLRDYYIPSEILLYYREYRDEHNIQGLDNGGITGAIVMNCNPFTKGHRYLIEYASAQVDLLYIFVVEEDASQFRFEDRINMVKAGTADLKNVCVLPSGRYIISKETFEQYFGKDSVTEVQDMDYDLHIFTDVIAREFDISIRYVGEEPFDAVTKKYNETMKRILPKGGVKVEEIPRLKNDEHEVISASLARKYINENRFEELGKYLPDSTVNYIKNMIF